MVSVETRLIFNEKTIALLYTSDYFWNSPKIDSQNTVDLLNT
jgi:hypothetical protein